MTIYQNYLDSSLSELKTIISESGTRPILFVGTGLSIRYINSPNWEGLLELLINKNPKIQFPLAYFIQNDSDLTKVASQLIDEYKNYAWEQHASDLYPAALYNANVEKSAYLKHEISNYFKELINGFELESHELREEIELLKQLKPQAIITTNYDQFLEQIFEEYTVTVGQQVIKSKNALKIGQILKIHGCVDRPEEIVISHEDYLKFNNKQRYLIAKLLTYFMEHPIIFLGYSISDPNIKSILSDVAEIVSDGSDKVVDNIWFIEWSREEISPKDKPPTDKTVDLGNGNSIRVNYILVNDFIEIFKTLDSHDISSINALSSLEDKIFNIIKSKSISELKVDYLSLERIENEEKLAELMGIQNVTVGGLSNVSVIGIGTLSDPEQIKTRYPLRLTDVARHLGFERWQYANHLINDITEKTGVNIKENSNRYHIDLNTSEGATPIHKYSMDIVELLLKVKNNEECTVTNALGVEINYSPFIEV